MTGIKSDVFKTASLTAKNKYSTLEEEVDDYAKKEIQANAGEEFRFNGIGMNIAARVIEVATKKKFEQLMRQRIFTPLGMRNTSFSTDDGSPASAFSHAKSSALDLTKFLQMLLNNGKFNGKQILSENAVAEMRKVQISPDRMKFSPKPAVGFAPALGTWAIEGAEYTGETATALAAPGLLGVWAMVDFKRGYTFILFPKSFTGEQNKNVFLGLKEEVDQLNLPVSKK
jgi:CubicO group peptidase (beta-lactamase class C family)